MDTNKNKGKPEEKDAGGKTEAGVLIKKKPVQKETRNIHGGWMPLNTPISER